MSAIAQAVGVHEMGGRPLQEILQDTLRERQLLLVLDNFEQVVTAGPHVGELVAACPYAQGVGDEQDHAPSLRRT